MNPFAPKTNVIIVGFHFRRRTLYLVRRGAVCERTTRSPFARVAMALRDDKWTENVIAGLRAGDQAARREFWHGYWDGIHAVCAGVLGDGLSATEVATEVMADFMCRWVHQLNHPTAAWSYLRLIAARRAAKERDDQAHSIFIDMDCFCAEAELSPEEAMADQQLLPLLQQCLGQLRPKAQRALKLRFYSDLTHEEIGNLLGGSKQYLGQLVRQCLSALRRCVQKEQRRQMLERAEMGRA